MTKGRVLWLDLSPQEAARMALQVKLQLVVVTDDGEQVSVDELVVLNKDHERLEQVGLTLAEAKALLLEVQRQILSGQIATFLASHTACPTCGRSRGIKDRKTTLFRTLFGKLEVASPRLRRCPCQHSGQASTTRSSSCCPSTPHLSCCIWRASGPRWSRMD
jgi:hypothetical protein